MARHVVALLAGGQFRRVSVVEADADHLKIDAGLKLHVRQHRRQGTLDDGADIGAGKIDGHDDGRLVHDLAHRHSLAVLVEESGLGGDEFSELLRHADRGFGHGCGMDVLGFGCGHGRERSPAGGAMVPCPE